MGEDNCKHHWMIDSPEGPTSKGYCRFCGEERWFVNGYDRRKAYEKRRQDRLDSKRERVLRVRAEDWLGDTGLRRDNTRRSGLET